MLLSAKNNNDSYIVIQETTVAIVDLKGKTALCNVPHGILSIMLVVSIEGFTSDISVVPATHHMFAQLVLSNIGNMLLFNIYTDTLFTTLSIYYGTSCPIQYILKASVVSNKDTYGIFNSTYHQKHTKPCCNYILHHSFFANAIISQS